MLKLCYFPDKLEAGCDEAGRGCLAGPVFAAAVIFPANFANDEIIDSKKLTFDQRLRLRPLIERSALAWAIGMADNQEIDKYNILNASILAMHRAIENLKLMPDFLLIDGNRFKKYKQIDHLCIVKGDNLYLNIAAASILAKTYRDDFMIQIHNNFPIYKWNVNKGYPTQTHREAIKTYGITPLHRKSFKLLELQYSLF